MDTVYIAFVCEPFENDVLIGVYATPGLAHKALGEYLEDAASLALTGRVVARAVRKEV